MKTWALIAVLMFPAIGCEDQTNVPAQRDAVAIEWTLATMTDIQPTPEQCERCSGTGWITHGDGHRTPCPECSDGSAGLSGGPIDTYRDARELIDKGNALADRGKAILDAAERDGKITVDVRLPTPSIEQIELGQFDIEPTAPDLVSACPGGTCTLPAAAARQPRATIKKSLIVQPEARACSQGVCVPRRRILPLLRGRR